MHLFPPEDSIDCAKNPRGPGVTRTTLWVSPGTPTRPRLFSGQTYFVGLFAIIFGLPNSASLLKRNFIPLE